MEIKLLKEYKKYPRGSVINVNKLIASLLIKKGFAELQLNSFKKDDLLVGELVTILRKRNGKDKETKHDSYRIFLKKTTNHCYTHAISGKKFLPSFFNLMDKFNVGDKAVNFSSLLDFNDYYKDDISTNNQSIDKTELQKLEDELNSNANHTL